MYFHDTTAARCAKRRLNEQKFFGSFFTKELLFETAFSAAKPGVAWGD
jgi:hypothetical protein